MDKMRFIILGTRQLWRFFIQNERFICRGGGGFSVYSDQAVVLAIELSCFRAFIASALMESRHTSPNDRQYMPS